MKNIPFSVTAKYFLFIPILCCYMLSYGQEPNYDESKIPPFVLPDPLALNKGGSVKSVNEWVKERRQEILDFFENQVYGKAPKAPADMHFKVLSEDNQALGGKATRKEINVYFSKKEDNYMTILMYLPNQCNKAAPLFVGLNFYGNYTVNADPCITMTQNWVTDQGQVGVIDNHANESLRGSDASGWPIDLILQSGYGVATIYCGDIAPDYDNGFQKGVFPLFYAAGQNKPKPNEWQNIAAWAWGLSRAMDYLETDKQVDAEKVTVIGHSRLGKAALWAGATDQRFAMIISNESGCGGAALSKRRIGETVQLINKQFPYWFCDNFKQYNEKEDALPFDQHELVALMAPRPVYIASAEEDQWADPKGEFLSGLYANPVYQLYGLTGMPVPEMPAVDQPVLSGQIAYHIRTGKHAITAYDWKQYIRFADKFFYSTQSTGKEKYFTQDYIHSIMKKTTDWQLKHPLHEPNDWTNGAFYAGVFAAWKTTRSQPIYNALLALGNDSTRWLPGNRWYSADDVAISQTYIDLYRIEKKREMIQPTIDTLKIFISKPYPTRDIEVIKWWWCDALFMGPPTLVKMGVTLNDPEYLKQNDVCYKECYDLLYNKKEHLFARDLNFVIKNDGNDKYEANGKLIFWSRGNGWVMGGLTRILAELPADYPERPFYEQLFKEMSARILSLQQPDGLWRASLLDPDSYPGGEVSGSGFFCYALAWGINNGLLDSKTYRPAVEKAWIALNGCVDGEGRVGWVQPIGADPRKNFSADSWEVYGTGAFLLAGSEVIKMQ